MIQRIESKLLMTNKTAKLCFLFLSLFILLHANAFASDYFWLTHVATPFKSKNLRHPAVSDPGYAPTIITIDGNKLFLNQNGCNVDIRKIVPFKRSKAFMFIVDDAGGTKKFDQFLKAKLRTDVKSWKTEYFTEVPNKDAGGPGCELLNGMIFRSENELIITDTSYFLRFSKGTESSAPRDYPKNSSNFGG
jgi:hypothetical protein